MPLPKPSHHPVPAQRPRLQAHSGRRADVAAEQPEGPGCVFWVDQQGRILDCCEEVETMFGYPHAELRGQHISRLLPALSGTELLRDGAINPRLAFQCRCAKPMRAVARDGQASCCTLFLNLVSLPGGPALTIILRRVSNQATA